MNRDIAAIGQEIIDKSVELSKLGSQLVAVQAKQEGPAETELNTLLSLIYDDERLTNVEFQQLRDEADRKVDALKALYPQSADLAGFQKAADDAVQLMQTGILGFKKQKLPPEAKAAVQEGYAYQVAYIKACLDRFTQML